MFSASISIMITFEGCEHFSNSNSWDKEYQQSLLKNRSINQEVKKQRIKNSNTKPLDESLVSLNKQSRMSDNTLDSVSKEVENLVKSKKSYLTIKEKGLSYFLTLDKPSSKAFIKLKSALGL